MSERRDTGATLNDECWIDIGDSNALVFAAIRQDAAPWIDDQRMTVAFRAAG